MVLNALPDMFTNFMDGGARTRNTVALWGCAGIAQRQQQVFTTCAFIQARDDDVGDPTEPDIIDWAEHLRRNFQNKGTILRVVMEHIVDGRGVSRQE